MNLIQKSAASMLLSILFLIFCISCEEKESILETEIVDNSDEVYEYVSPNEDKLLADLLNNVPAGEANAKLSKGIANKKIGKILTERIVKRISYPDQPQPIYSMPLVPNRKSGKYEWLVLEPVRNGYVGYILQYQPKKNFDLLNFTGIARVLNLDREVEFETSFENGKQLLNTTENSRTYTGCDCEWEIKTKDVIGPVTGQVIGQDVEVWLHCECTDEPPMFDDGGSGGGGTGGGFGSPIGGGGTGGGGTPGDSGGSGGLIGQPSHCDGGAGFADENGNCFSMEQVLAAELVNLLSQDPDALIDLPCSELQKYQTLAQHKVAGSGLRKLQNLQSSRDQNFWQELTGTDDWQVQDINEAAGTVVNMDYFPITISKLPNGYTAASLLEHIRKNINDFTNDDAYFQPYPGIAGEEALWNSSNPLDAILSIDITPHDGSVIVSDKRTHRWILSVIQSPLDYQHPVSGNREFGYIRNSDGSYTFYTRGVDRISQTLISGARDVIFLGNYDVMDQADNLWESFQDKIKTFVDQNGGSSSLPSDRNQGARPDWERIKKYLNGEITLNQLRNDC